MEASGCPLDEAFGEFDNIKLKKKVKKEKKRTDIIYPNELKPIDSHFQDEVKSIQGYDNTQYFDINGPTNTYGTLHPIKHNEHINSNVVSQPNKPHTLSEHQNVNQPPSIKNYQIDNQNTSDSVKKEKHLQNERNIISNKEYEEFKDFQRKRYFENHQRKLSQLEGFSNVNDDFNDVLLFGLMGVFFLIFTDYIYKLGKKSY
jgi:hypothetical protein